MWLFTTKHRPSPSLLALVTFVTFVWSLNTASAAGLRVALVAHGDCLTGPDDVLPQVSRLLSQHGHEPTIVSESGLANELEVFDVVLLGAGPFLCEWNWSLDETIAAYVEGGGGLVATGWVAYYLAENTRQERYPGLEYVLPVLPGTSHHVDPSVMAISGHPITEDVQSFVADYDSTGGGLREGSTPLLRVNDTFIGAAWEVNQGRAVYLGVNYLGSWAYYDNRRLLDGSQPEAERLLLQAIEWSGHER